MCFTVFVVAILLYHTHTQMCVYKGRKIPYRQPITIVPQPNSDTAGNRAHILHFKSFLHFYTHFVAQIIVGVVVQYQTKERGITHNYSHSHSMA